jgi:hypothetical protein
MKDAKPEKSIAEVSKKLEADIIVYSGLIDLKGTERILEITQKPINPNVFLILCTSGGDPHAAYKIARRLQEKYSLFYLYVYGYCKSAGTLIAVGADEIIMSDFAEFGPLDVQLPEKDEIRRWGSGLNIEESLRTLKEETIIFFRSTLIELTDSAGISTVTAAELATNLAIAFTKPIVSQIDPSRIGETQRAIKIALAYGERLSKSGNLLTDGLMRLIQEYPDHSFVIDFEEARSIFKNIRKHDANEESMGCLLNIKYPSRKDQIINRIYFSENTDEANPTEKVSQELEKNEKIQKL